MIVLFSDFGAQDLYLGQVRAQLNRYAPNVPVIDLLNEVPNFNIEAGAHLLASLCKHFDTGSVFFAVVDPGVGSKRDKAVMVADGYWFVGPDNGLLSVIAARAKVVRTWRITWEPENLTNSFHGRDIFGPVTAWIAAGKFPVDKLEPTEGLTFTSDGSDLQEIIYVDHYGNGFTGIRASSQDERTRISINGQELEYARTFSEVSPGKAFWYPNSVGLVEIAVNKGNAVATLNLAVGQKVSTS